MHGAMSYEGMIQATCMLSGSRLALIDLENKISVWDLKRGVELRSWDRTLVDEDPAEFSPSNALFATRPPHEYVGIDACHLERRVPSVIRLWDPNTGTLAHALRGHDESDILDICVLPNGWVTSVCG